MQKLKMIVVKSTWRTAGVQRANARASRISTKSEARGGSLTDGLEGTVTMRASAITNMLHATTHVPIKPIVWNSSPPNNGPAIRVMLSVDLSRPLAAAKDSTPEISPSRARRTECSPDKTMPLKNAAILMWINRNSSK